MASSRCAARTSRSARTHVTLAQKRAGAPSHTASYSLRAGAAPVSACAACCASSAAVGYACACARLQSQRQAGGGPAARSQAAHEVCSYMHASAPALALLGRLSHQAPRVGRFERGLTGHPVQLGGQAAACAKQTGRSSHPPGVGARRAERLPACHALCGAAATSEHSHDHGGRGAAPPRLLGAQLPARLPGDRGACRWAVCRAAGTTRSPQQPAGDRACIGGCARRAAPGCRPPRP